jgi:hypothetical protein
MGWLWSGMGWPRGGRGQAWPGNGLATGWMHRTRRVLAVGFSYKVMGWAAFDWQGQGLPWAGLAMGRPRFWLAMGGLDMCGPCASVDMGWPLLGLPMCWAGHGLLAMGWFGPGPAGHGWGMGWAGHRLGEVGLVCAVLDWGLAGNVLGCPWAGLAMT